ncbi:hypothetical protein M0804_012481 [Polistes exclamans]|nr:hypothetical protein M0804_012481 [Polistes exclamans]
MVFSRRKNERNVPGAHDGIRGDRSKVSVVTIYVSHWLAFTPVISNRNHLKALEVQLRTYFILNIDFQKIVWIQKPFCIGLSEIDQLPLKAQEEFAELSSDSNLKLQFQKKPLTEFSIGTRTEFPIIADMALNVLLPFNTTYLC